ncbi:MAG: dipeptidase [Acidimicrobiia bacterium]|jgi:membrane dipeptidase
MTAHDGQPPPSGGGDRDPLDAAPAATSFAARARRIHDRLPVIDGHNDLPWELRTRAGSDLDLADPRGDLRGYHTDVPRLLRGGVGGQFWSVYVPARSEAPLRDTIEQVMLVRRMVERDPDQLALAVTADDIVRIRAEGRIACLMGAEGGHSIEGSLGALQALAALGVRYLTLTHADSHDWADSATDDARHGGLAAFGEEVVHEMNRLGMMVDVSHVSADTMRHAIRVSDAPVIASHSSARALADHPRNVPDDVLTMIGEKGGVVMVNFYPGFVVAATAERAQGMFSMARRLRARFGPDEDTAFEQAMQDLVAARDWDRGSVRDVADHIEHIADVAGVDHVGLGSDFDGVDMTPEGLDDVSCYPAITEELLRRGWSDGDVLRVLGENLLAVMRQVEEVAAATR